MSCKDEVKSLGKTYLSNEQSKLLESFFMIMADEKEKVSDDLKSWYGCLIAAGLKYQHQWYGKAWFGALIASVFFLIILGGKWLWTRS